MQDLAPHSIMPNILLLEPAIESSLLKKGIEGDGSPKGYPRPSTLYLLPSILYPLLSVAAKLDLVPHSIMPNIVLLESAIEPFD